MNAIFSSGALSNIQPTYLINNFQQNINYAKILLKNIFIFLLFKYLSIMLSYTKFIIHCFAYQYANNILHIARGIPLLTPPFGRNIPLSLRSPAPWIRAVSREERRNRSLRPQSQTLSTPHSVSSPLALVWSIGKGSPFCTGGSGLINNG